MIPAAERTVRSYRAAGSLEAIAYAWNAKGIALVALGRAADALDVLQAARQQASELEDSRGEGVCLYNLAWVYWVDGQHGPAADTADRATVAFQLAGASEAAATQALAEAARAREADPRTAAGALHRAAGATGANAEIIRREWLSGQAELLLAEVDAGR